MPYSQRLRAEPWGTESEVDELTRISPAELQRKRIHYAEEWMSDVHFRVEFNYSTARSERLYNLPLLMAESLWGVKSDSYKIVLAHWQSQKEHSGLW